MLHFCNLRTSNVLKWSMDAQNRQTRRNNFSSKQPVNDVLSEECGFFTGSSGKRTDSIAEHHTYSTLLRAGARAAAVGHSDIRPQRRRQRRGHQTAAEHVAEPALRRDSDDQVTVRRHPACLPLVSLSTIPTITPCARD